MNASLRAAFAAALLVLTTSAWAHVVVTPKQAGIGSWLTFNVSVPNEKDVATTEIKLIVPPGMGEVTPTVKAGWTVVVEKDSAGHASAIVWRGTLPTGFRDDFTFSGQAPSQPGELDWKAYQTYQGGIVVGWDADPASSDAKDPEAMEKMNKGPYSVTKVVDDLAAPPRASGSDIQLPLSIVALVLAAVAAVLAVIALRRRN